MTNEINLTKKYLSNMSILERMYDFNFLLILLSLVVYSDTVLVLTKKTSITKITSIWIESNLTIGDIIIYVAFYSFLMSTVFPYLKINTTYYYKDIKNKLFSDSDENLYKSPFCIFENDLVEYSVKNNNSVTYSIYKEHQTQKNKNLFVSNICYSLILLVIANLLISIPHKTTFSLYLSTVFFKLPNIAQFFVGLFVLFTFMKILYIALETDTFNNRYVALKKSIIIEKTST